VSIHTKGTAYFLLRGHLRDNTTKAGGTGLMRGGMGTISQALAESGRRYGMEVRTGAEVQKIRVSDNRTEGVVLKSGEEIRARTVISNASARHTFLDLLDDRELPPEFLRDIRGFNGKATAFKVHLAVTGLPHFPGVAEEGLDAYPAQICIAPSIEYMEEAFRQVQQGSVSRRPYLTVQAPSAIDPGLAPAGRHLLSIYGGHVPSGDQSAEARQEVLSNVLNTIAEYTPDLANSVVEAQVMLPSDYERVFGLPGGHPHHADLSLDQLFFRRPARRYANYTSPIHGLFLCSASTHPGGGVTGVPGYNAARVVLKSKRMRPS
jgi:phytoene dehydrogenase-like protein